MVATAITSTKKSVTQSKSTQDESLIEPKLLNKAINALLKHHESEMSKEGDKKQLLGNDQSIHVQFNLTKIPEQISARPIRIEIPHSMNKLNKGQDDTSATAFNDDDDDDNDGLDEAEVCLIVKDSSKEWVQTLISNFPKQMSYIKKVLSLTSLRKKYTQYQDRRTLCNTYTLFLVDDSILPMVGKLLGKSFFMKKKQPVPVKLSRKEALPFAIEKCVKSTFLVIGAGTCVSIKAAATTMSSGSINDNIQAVIRNAICHIPRKASNISSISIKTDSSVALPIYNKVRQELDNISKLAKVESKKTELKTKTATTTAKKRALDDDGDMDDNKEGDANKIKKQKKVDAVKSPLLKALKKSKKNETKIDKDLNTKGKSKDSTPKKKKKRTSSEIESKDPDSSTTEKKSESPKKKVKESKDTPEKRVKESKDTPEKKVKESKDTPEKKVKEGKKTPEKKVKEGKKTPEKKVKESKKTPEKKVKESKATPSKESTTKKKENATFIASKTFKGSKKGYVFKKDKQGVGYYIDKKPVPDKAALAALGRSGSKGKGRRQSAGGKPMKKGRNKRRSSY